MGIAVVLVTPAFIENSLLARDQFTAIRIMDGLPEASRLVDVALVSHAGHLQVQFKFEGPGLPEPVAGQPPRVITPRIATAPALFAPSRKSRRG